MPDLLSPCRPSWYSLFEIDKRPERVTSGEETYQVLRGYIYPPVQLFLATELRLEFLHVWLVMRRVWMGHIAAAVYDLTRKLAPSPQSFKQWFRDMVAQWLPGKLIARSGQDDKKRDASGATKAQTERRLAAAEESFSFIGELDERLPFALTYSGWTIKREQENPVTPEMLQLALWELSELNFRAELMILDRYQVPDVTRLFQQASDSRVLVAECCVATRYTRPQVPSFSKILGYQPV